MLSMTARCRQRITAISQNVQDIIRGMIDLNLIERGADYSELKKSYIIFICPFDEFKARVCTSIRLRPAAKNYQITLEDEVTKIFCVQEEMLMMCH